MDPKAELIEGQTDSKSVEERNQKGGSLSFEGQREVPSRGQDEDAEHIVMNVDARHSDTECRDHITVQSGDRDRKQEYQRRELCASRQNSHGRDLGAGG